jgi:hypothetical protein
VPDFDVPADIKLHFEKLTMIEEIIIPPVQQIMSIYRLPGGRLVSRRCVANFSQNLDALCKGLPRIPSDISIIILKKDGIPDDFKTAIVGQNEANNLTKNENKVSVDELIKQETELPLDDTYHAYIETEIEDFLEVDKINVKLNWPITNPVPLVEFNFDGICTLACP